ncbi:bifunctional phosphopantothenoylcysteine decarboxylase/phosphopantothenate--cysteine ligase CoaBC [Marinilabilia rubra]|uniref:Coenzyme A biosynthesis bifunctional protein CoaBC n=1 Tax=Marinilabilia rubra TaxID=2162893 RepID=A0A2U2BCP8_9BACT|nr:bifunctional phosphopantothenoylcysteine decarboxylase/phosphopantothenate--cysteine ligase CoaBC [Marinilabilia rubra]PWE00803.1 bifunctional phosphopantothenoylcysteine decarboxylase/phosphopantothenate--cysteine ligase CoaBC [Marinilabilia rubra]
MLKGKKVILGITGSIAAYKAAYLLRLLVKEGAEVQVIITPAGKEFITTVTLSALSGKPVLSEFFENTDGSWHSHVDLGIWADIMVVAPASANTMGKMVNAICDNLLITTYLSAKCPVVVAPAMDLDMFAHPANQRNVDVLRQFGAHIVEPGTGELASGLEGKGRMEEPDGIVERLKEILGSEKKKSLSGKKVLVTAGPTYENIDPVRFIGNYSSGKMGFAIAEELATRGAEVSLIAGPVSLNARNSLINRTDVVSANEMDQVCQEIFPDCDAAVFAAAVSDYAPENKSEDKIKRSSDNISLQLRPNPDVAARAGIIKKKGQITVGFALETNNEEVNAAKKVQTKNFDFIVLNSPNNEGEGFMTDTNRISIIHRDHKKENFPLKSKQEVACDIVNVLEQKLLS